MLRYTQRRNLPRVKVSKQLQLSIVLYRFYVIDCVQVQAGHGTLARVHGASVKF